MPYTPVSCGTAHSFRDTRTMLYAYWGSACQSERAPAFRENAFWSRVLDCGRETEVSRSTDKISKSLSKWSPLEGKSCHLAREEWFFYSTGHFFKEIAVLWRNSSVLSDDESTTTRVNVRVQRKSEKRKGPVQNNIVGFEGKKGLCQYGLWLSISLLVWVVLWCLASDKLSVAWNLVESVSLCFWW